jgi:hypothetical protein
MVFKIAFFLFADLRINKNNRKIGKAEVINSTMLFFYFCAVVKKLIFMAAISMLQAMQDSV